MLTAEGFTSCLVLAPHADDEALGCGGLMAALASQGCPVHVVYFAVDGFHHYGLDQDTTFGQRRAEIEHVTMLFDNCTWEIAYPDQGLIERLDTVPQQDLVTRIERVCDARQPELVLLPSGADYDQDHRAVFRAGLAATRPIPGNCGKHLARQVLTYEMTKLQWAAEPSPLYSVLLDITAHLDTKLEAIRRYTSQLRASPHIRSLEAVTALARVRGTQIGTTYGEAYQPLRIRL
jgi:LmbE family N-acetylglucosaminyl deacetylase